MKNACLVFSIALIILSCRHKSQTVDKKDTVISQKQKIEISDQPPQDTTPIIADTTKKIVGYTVEHSFSDPNYKDIFSINLYGKKILGGVVVFEIFDHDHKSIFKEKFFSEDLLGDLADMIDDAQKQDTIRVRMKTFFNENRFHAPAIDTDEKFDMAYSNSDSVDKAEWEEIKQDRSAMGFVYNYGYEGTYGIAYNKKRHHVFLVFYSD